MEQARAVAAAPDIRVATLQDGPAILELYRGLSEHSRLMRFSAPPSDRALQQAADLDPKVDFQAVVAVVDGRVVGEARIGSMDDTSHDFALTIADDAQRRGIGSALLERLRAEARVRGIVSLRAMVRIDNVPMLTLLRRIGGALILVSGGEALIDIATDDRMPGWPSGTAGTRVLVEAPGLIERPISASLRAAGYTVRQCAGPGRGRREPCPVLTVGECRLADDADRIVCLLPENDPLSRQVAAAHATDRPDQLGASLG